MSWRKRLGYASETSAKFHIKCHTTTGLPHPGKVLNFFFCCPEKSLNFVYKSWKISRFSRVLPGQNSKATNPVSHKRQQDGLPFGFRGSYCRPHLTTCLMTITGNNTQCNAYACNTDKSVSNCLLAFYLSVLQV